jgi:hypothetical protein
MSTEGTTMSERKKDVIFVVSEKLNGATIQVVHEGVVVIGEVNKLEVVGKNVRLTVHIFLSEDFIVVERTIPIGVDVATFEEVYYSEHSVRC